MPYENKTKTTKEPKQDLLKIHRGNKERVNVSKLS